MAKIKEIEQLLKGLGSRKRLEILAELRKRRTATASDLAQALHISRPAASQHLRILRHVGVVIYKKRGQYVSYRINLDQNPLTRHLLRML